MKKILIGTTALVAAGCMATDASAADKIALGLGGYMNTFIGTSSNENTYNNAQAGLPNIGGFDVQQDAEIHVKGSTKLDNGLTVSVKTELETHQGSSASAVSTNVDSTSVSISSATLGTIDLGSDDIAADKMHVAPGTASGFGLELGDAQQWISKPSGVQSERWTRATGATDPMGISYRSPSFSGFQVGASYASSAADEGGNINGATADRNLWSAALGYSGKFDDVSVKGSVYYAAEGSGDGATTQPAGRDAVGVGLKVGFGAFEVAGAYKSTDQGKVTGGTSLDGTTWDVGVAYTSGPMKLSAGYMVDEREGTVATAADDKTTHMQVAGSYDLGGGIKMSATVHRAEYDDETTANGSNNDGWAAVAGVEVSF